MLLAAIAKPPTASVSTMPIDISSIIRFVLSSVSDVAAPLEVSPNIYPLSGPEGVILLISRYQILER